METQMQRPVIDYHTTRFIVGLIALSLALLTDLLTPIKITSISQSYHLDDNARDIFVGSLFVISAFLWSYNGYPTPKFMVSQSVLSKIAAVAAAFIAYFPCDCAPTETLVGAVHSYSAIILFVILAIFCWFFYLRTKGKPSKQAGWRGRIYRLCAFAMIIVMSLQLIDMLSSGVISEIYSRLTYYVEMIGLLAFGIAWMVASRMIPFLTDKDERLPLF